MLAQTKTAAPRYGLTDSAELFTSLGAQFRAWRDARRTRALLERLTDHELEDIGLTRGQIHAVSAHPRNR